MILPDVNTLVYAFRRETHDHDAYSKWLSEIVAGAGELALVDHCLMGFMRIVTNPRIFNDPAPTGKAGEFVTRIRGARRSRRVSSTPATWSTLADLISKDRAIKANLVPDAYLAALALSHGCRIATADRGFARFDGLDFFDPVAN